jgi:hypothetical protein
MLRRNPRRTDPPNFRAPLDAATAIYSRGQRCERGRRAGGTRPDQICRYRRWTL